MDWKPLLKFRIVAVILIHAALATIAWYAAWWLRLQSGLWDPDVVGGVDYLRVCNDLLPFVLAARMLAFWYFDLYQGLWRYVSLTDLINLLKATLAASLVYPFAILAMTHFRDVPSSALVAEPILCLMLCGGVRLAVRVYREVFSPAPRGGRRVVVVGAGDAGEMLLREMRAHRHLGYEAVGFVDDDARKRNTTIHGVPVLGGLDDIGTVVQATGAEEVIMAIPSAGGVEYTRILEQCAASGARLRRLPRNVSDIVRLTELRDVAVEDLLGR